MSQKLFTRISGVIVAVAALTATILVTPAAGLNAGRTSDPTIPEIDLTAAEQQALQTQIDRHLDEYGGGKQVGINEITYHGGRTILTLPLPGETKARAVDEPPTALGTANCSYEYACLWSDTNFNGQRLASAACRTLTLGAPFNPSTASIHNNQTPGTQTMILNGSRQILNANFPGSRVNDTGVGSRTFARFWLVCP